MRRQGNWLFNFHKSFKWFMPANISKLFEIRNNFLQFWKLKYELLRIKFKFFTCHSIIPRQSESEIKFHQLIRSTIWFRFPFSIPTPCFLYQDSIKITFFPCPVLWWARKHISTLVDKKTFWQHSDLIFLITSEGSNIKGILSWKKRVKYAWK